jgi:hypothetical protein
MPWILIVLAEKRQIFFESVFRNFFPVILVKMQDFGDGSKRCFRVGLENRFQGHTSWQISQPNIQLSNLSFIVSGMSRSFNSMVKYEMHLLPSTTLPGSMACVGQASMQRVQDRNNLLPWAHHSPVQDQRSV